MSAEVMEVPGLQQLSAPPSDVLLHAPCDVTLRSQLAALIGRSLVTEFPVNRMTPAAEQLSSDEAAELLLSPGSPWRREPWWSADILPLLESAVRSGHRVTGQYLASRLHTLSMPLQNISALGGEVHALGSLTVCSLACNELTCVRGGDLPRSLTSLQLYGNPLGDLRRLLRNCPPLEYLGLGRIQLTDDGLQDFICLVSNALPSLRVLDLCDNHISDLAHVTSLLMSSPYIRAVCLSGNPAFLVTGYYEHFLAERGRLQVLDGVELTENLLDLLRDRAQQQQQQQQQERASESAADNKAGKKPGKKAGKKQAQKSLRRPALDLDPSRFEPSLTSVLVKLTGVIYLPFIPKEQYPGQEVCAVFQWGGSSTFPPPTVSLDQADGQEEDQSTLLRPLEALLVENNDVTVLDQPLEWHCSDPRAMRDAILKHLRIVVLRREKWSPMKKKKGNKNKDKKKDSPAKGDKGNAKGKTGSKKGKKDSTGKGEARDKKKGKDKDDSPEKEKMAAVAPPEEENRPPPELYLASAELPTRPLLRPSAPLLLQASTGGACTRATPTETHWMDAIQHIQEEKKMKKAAAKKAAAEEAKTNKKDTKGKKKKGKEKGSMSARSAPTKTAKEENQPKPMMQFFFSIELYRKPAIDFPNADKGIMPIESLE